MKSSYEKLVCPKCGHEVREGDKFCSNCGGQYVWKKIPPLTDVDIRTKKVCPKCGKEYKKGEKFCPIDGGRIEEKKTETPIIYRKL